MNRKSLFFFYTLFSLLALLTAQIISLYTLYGMNDKSRELKRSFVGTIALPDLAVSTEASYIRHRSLADFFSIYKDDGSLREYFGSTYVYKANDAR